MANKSPFDSAVDILLKRQKMADTLIGLRFKGARPFRQIPLTKEEMLTQYNNMSPEDMMQRINQNGGMATNDYIAKMESLKRGMK